jgi:type VI secretion system secreted protein VgrG
LARNNVAVERARLSEHVYASDQLPPVAAPEGWHQLTARELARRGVTPAMLNDPESGFKAALYQSSFERPPKLVVAHAGTENGADWTTNLHQGIGLETKQYNNAMKLAQTVVRNSQTGTVDIAGHSLGGGLASAASVVTKAKGYTFNAAGLHPNTVARAPYGVSAASMVDRGQRIDAYHSAADPLTNLQSATALAQGPWPPYTLGPEALGVPHELTPAGQWRHGWGELVTRHPLDAGTKMALDGHGVDPQLVDHLEHQKDQDTATLTRFVAAAP